MIPVGSDGAWQNEESAAYEDSMLRMHLFARSFDFNELANRTLDELQLHLHHCGEALPPSHFASIYANTRPGNPLRLFAAVAAAVLKLGPRETERYREGCRHISKLVKDVPEFEEDAKRAESKYGQILRVHSAASRDIGHGIARCEFHVHFPGEICHATGRPVPELEFAAEDFAITRPHGKEPSSVPEPEREQIRAIQPVPSKSSPLQPLVRLTTPPHSPFVILEMGNYESGKRQSEPLARTAFRPHDPNLPTGPRYHIPKPSIVDLPFRCPICRNRFPSKKPFVRHGIKIHEGIDMLGLWSSLEVTSTARSGTHNSPPAEMEIAERNVHEAPSRTPKLTKAQSRKSEGRLIRCDGCDQEFSVFGIVRHNQLHPSHRHPWVRR